MFICSGFASRYHSHGYIVARRNEINRLQTKKPNPGERRCVDNLIEVNDTNESDRGESNNSDNDGDDDEDSDAVVGEIDDDRLDDDGEDTNGQEEDSSKSPILLIRKLLYSVQARKRLESIANSANNSNEENSNEEHEKVITPTKIVNGRPVSGGYSYSNFLIL
jgi:hypothetical protein